MAGTSEGNRKSAETMRKKYGEDYFKKIAARGGKRSKLGGFASETIGKDGLTGKERASQVGAIGGKWSKFDKL